MLPLQVRHRATRRWKYHLIQGKFCSICIQSNVNYDSCTYQLPRYYLVEYQFVGMLQTSTNAWFRTHSSFGQYRVQPCSRSLQAYLDGYICYWIDTYERVHGMMHTPLIVFGSFLLNDTQSCYLCHWKIWLKRGRSGAGMLTLNIGFSRMVWAPLSIVAATAHISNTYHQSGYEEGMGQTYVPLSRKNAHFKALFLPLSPDRFFMRPSNMDTTLMWFM